MTGEEEEHKLRSTVVPLTVLTHSKLRLCRPPPQFAEHADHKPIKNEYDAGNEHGVPQLTMEAGIGLAAQRELLATANDTEF
jgi:hypothetical protein